MKLLCKPKSYLYQKKTLCFEFCLKPLAVPKNDCWFSPVAVGHNKLHNMMKKMCEEAGIGHHSIDGIRSYKRTSTEQMMVVSDILNYSPGPNKKIKTTNNSAMCVLVIRYV